MLDGIEYVKASVVAEDFKYTSDYIGQLCRNKKVDARLVGRTWFVNPLSITEHKRSKYGTINAIDDQEQAHQVHVSVEPVIKSKTLKTLLANNTYHKLTEQRNLHVAYDLDDEALMPNLTKKVLPPPKKIRIEQADAKTVRVGGRLKEFAFMPSTMPEISLSGKLKVTEIPEAEPEVVESTTSDSYENKAISTNSEKMSVKIKPHPTTFSKIEKARDRSIKLKKLPQQNNPLQVGQVTKIEERSKTQTPDAKKSGEIRFSPTSVEKAQPVKISTVVLASPLIATVLALVVVTALFSASSRVVVSKATYQSEIILQVANVLEILRQ